VKKESRFLSALAVLILVSSLAACGGANPTATPQPTATTAAVPTNTTVAAIQESTAAPVLTPTTAEAVRGEIAPTMPITPTTAPGSDTPTMAMTATAAPESGTPPPAGTSTTAADLGFRANPNGFSFPNYSGNYPTTPGTLTLDAVRKMFGDANVCVSVSNGTCTAKQEATLWIDQQNKGLNGGSCEGFAVASLRMFEGEIKPSDFDPNASKVYDLKLDDKVRSQIAVDWALQGVEPVSSFGAQTRTKTPSQILDLISAALSNPSGDQYTLGIWHGKEGHAVLPYSVEDKGNGLFWVHVYDNNYPGDDKYVAIDRNANTWVYALAAINPAQDASPWGGGVGGDPMDLTSLSVRDGKLICPWCGQGGSGGLLQANGGDSRQVWLDGSGDLLITDAQGNKLGYDNGKFVNDIPGAYDTVLKGGALVANHEPIYYLPPSGNYNIDVTGSNLTGQDTEELALFGQGMTADVTNIKLDKGMDSQLSLSGGQTLDFKAGEAESPDIKLAVESGGKDYLVDINGLSAQSGQDISMSLDETTGKLAVKDSANTDEQINLTVTEEDASGTHSFKHNGVDLAPGNTDTVDFGTWNDQGGMNVEVQDSSTVQVVDESNQP
jgi:predicted small lipoprotein YifL